MTKTIIFQGDSITDARRLQSENEFGFGYVNKTIAELKKYYADLTFYNKGISGNRTEDLVKRWEEDTIELYPDIVTILIGINDVIHDINHGIKTTDEQFIQNYTDILERTQNTGAKIIMIQPFLFNHAMKNEEVIKRFLTIKGFVDTLAQKYADIYIKADEFFKNLTKTHDPNTFSIDAVHLEESGASTLASLLVPAIAEIL